MSDIAFQDLYDEATAHCYGCGRMNEHGLQIKSYWDGDVSVCVFEPKPYHTAIPGLVYGGLLASLIDCHSTGTASAALARKEGRPIDSEPPVRCVTSSLKVEYLAPTPLVTLRLEGTVSEINGRFITITSTISANGEITCKGEVVAASVSPRWIERVQESLKS